MHVQLGMQSYMYTYLDVTYMSVDGCKCYSLLCDEKNNSHTDINKTE